MLPWFEHPMDMYSQATYEAQSPKPLGTYDCQAQRCLYGGVPSLRWRGTANRRVVQAKSTLAGTAGAPSGSPERRRRAPLSARACGGEPSQAGGPPLGLPGRSPTLTPLLCEGASDAACAPPTPLHPGAKAPCQRAPAPCPKSAAHASQKQNRERSQDDHPFPGWPGWHLRRGGRLEAATRGAARLLVRQPHVLHEARVRRAVALALSAARSHRLPIWLASGSQLACARRLALCVQQSKDRTRNSTALWPVQGCHWVVNQTPDASCRTGSPRTQPAPQPDCVSDCA